MLSSFGQFFSNSRFKLVVMKKIFSIIFIFCFFVPRIWADDFFWVNNGGNWSDYANHWAVSSGGNTMHNRLPGPGDRVFFDANSFSSGSQLVSVDLDTLIIDEMHWTNASHRPEFFGSTNKVLIIREGLWLAESEAMAFNFFGLIRFESATPGQTLHFTSGSHTLSADLIIECEAGELSTTGDLNMPQNKLIIYDGTLNMNDEDITVFHFNTGETPSDAATVLNPGLAQIDSVICSGSFHLPAAFDISNFSAYLIFSAKTEQDNYINTGNHILSSDFIFSGNKNYYLLSNLNTQGSISIPFSGNFFTQNHNISCRTFKSIASLSRTIDLGNGSLTTGSFEISRTGLSLISENADLIFNSDANMLFSSNQSALNFNSLTVNCSETLSWHGNLQANTTHLIAGSRINLSGGSVLESNSFTAVGDCGNYIEIRAICNPNYEESVCASPLPTLRTTTPVTAEYLKVSFINAEGSFSANNSFDEGGNQGWTFNEPSNETTLYWIGNSGDWHNPANWSSSSGGSPQACSPTKHSHVIFDDASFSGNNAVSLEGYGYCASFTWEKLDTNPIFEGNGQLFITDHVKLHSALNFNYEGTIKLQSTKSYTVTFETNGTEITAPVIIDGTAEWDFKDGPIIHNQLTLNAGKLKFSGLSGQFNSFLSEGTENRELNIQNTTITLQGEDAVWTVSNSGMNLLAEHSEIIINNTVTRKTIFRGGDFIYGILDIRSPFAGIEGNNTFERIHLLPGHTLSLESGALTTIDSLDAQGDCSQVISLISESSDAPAVLAKSGHDSLEVNYFFIQNIEAQAQDDGIFEAANSTGQGILTGWTFTYTPTAEIYQWHGNSPDWHDLSNWTIGGSPAICLPDINDIVLIDPTEFDAAAYDSIFIGQTAHCAEFRAVNLNRPLTMSLEQDLFIRSELQTDAQVTFKYTEEPTYGNYENYDFGLNLIPDGTDFIIDPNGADMAVNIYTKPSNPTSAVKLQSNSDLNMCSVSGLYIINGTFETMASSTLTLGYFETLSAAGKTLNLQDTEINIFNHLKFQESSFLNFNGDNSDITFVGNNQNYSVLEGNGQTFHSVTVNGNTGESTSDLFFVLSGDNTFENFEINNGVYALTEFGSQQTINGDFRLSGTCQNEITLRSSSDGNQSQFANIPSSSYVTCAVVQDIQVQDGTLAKLSTDVANNSGWNFDPTPAADASFTLPNPACINTDLTFVNTSESMYGGMTNLSFDWQIAGNSISTAQDLLHLFDNGGNYVISLTATDILTGCSDIYEETLIIESFNVQLSSDEPDKEICAGETVSFNATSDKATEFTFYLNNIPINLGSPTVDTYTTSTLTDGDIIRVEAHYNGCTQSSNELIFTVNPLPSPSMICSETDTTICTGGTISFTAFNSEEYRFFLDGSSVGSFSDDSFYEIEDPADQTLVRLQGKNEYGCIAYSADEYIINVLPLPNVTITPDIIPAEICSGQNLGFTANGAETYEFFVNGVSQGLPASNNWWETNLLQHNDIVTVAGTDSEACSALSTGISITVNESPEPVLNSDQPGNTICSGETVNFYAEGAYQYEFFIDGLSQGTMSTQNTFSTNGLSHLQSISVMGQIGNCTEISNPIVFEVYPDIELESDVTTICPGETVTFTASGDTVYQFFIDGVPASPITDNPVFTSTALNNGQTVSVSGTPGACEPPGISITVRPAPTAQLNCSDSDLTICEGDEAIFTATGGSEYEFFIDGISQAPPSGSSQFITNTLENDQTVSVTVYSVYGCAAEAPQTYTMTVNPYPLVSLTASNPSGELCADDTLDFFASGADEYLFFLDGNPQGEYSSNNEFSVFNLTGDPTISVSGRASGCASDAPEIYNYSVYSLPNVSLYATGPISLCVSDTLRVEAQGAVEYEFFVNSVSQGSPSTLNVFESNVLNDLDTISVLGYQNICSSSAEDSIVVNINPIPNLSLSSNMGTDGICYGETAQFLAEGAWEYQFYLDGIPYGEIQTEGTLEISNLENGQTISLTGYNNACARDIEEGITALIHTTEAEIHTSAETNAVCSGDSIMLYASGGDLYEFFINGNSTGIASGNSEYLYENIQEETVVNVEVSKNETGCTNMSPDYIILVRAIPEIWAVPDESFCENDSVILESDSEVPGQWFFNSELLPGASDISYTSFQGGLFSFSSSYSEEGIVQSFGSNASGQLGDGSELSTTEGTRTGNQVQFVSLSAGEAFMLAIDESQNLYAWGNNDWGNLGLGNYSSQSIPTEIAVLNNITQTAAGYYHSLAVNTNGHVYAWGQNTYGQLGFGNYSAANFPVAITSLNNIHSVAAGKRHSLALTNHGKIFTWGNNEFGQLGNGSFTNSPSPVMISGPDSVVFIAAGAFHSIAIDQDGKVWTWGRNENGQLGNGTINTSNVPIQISGIYKAVQAAGGAQHSLVLSHRGEIFAWGGNSDGQTGAGQALLSPVKVCDEGFVQTEAGLFTSYARRSDGTVWAWGLNNFGQLGRGDTQSISYPEKADRFFGTSDIAAGNDFSGAVWAGNKVCSSEEIDVIEIQVPEVTIENNGNILSTISGIAYQWYFNDNPIPGANTQSITADAGGNYTVEVFFTDGCSAVSEVFSYTTGLSIFYSEGHAQIRPNPNQGVFRLQLNYDTRLLDDIHTCRLVNLTGETIRKQKHFKARKSQTINYQDLPSGLYHLVLDGKSGQIRLKVLITQ